MDKNDVLATMREAIDTPTKADRVREFRLDVVLWVGIAAMVNTEADLTYDPFNDPHSMLRLSGIPVILDYDLEGYEIVHM